jgi:hypothetical protein
MSFRYGVVYPDRVKANGKTVLKMGHDIFLPDPSEFTLYKSAYNILPCGGEIFCTCSDRHLGTPSLLYNGYRVFRGGKERPGRDDDPSQLLVPWS